MKVFSIIPKIETKDGTCPRVDSYLKKAVKLGKELFGDNFTISEAKIDSWGEWIETWKTYDCNGVLIADKNGKVRGK